ncbi:hypothetical protein KUTeg_009929 [Tegillarca granosa]|uniref:Uncharacterized protein n=1 Tax=Tegillarca granosa TaxID=220873 RepID=A0ABQ9F7K8_TEGGR|nr:hypothetical protein KUTeg_009929 [Tegillarca granosa]
MSKESKDEKQLKKQESALKEHMKLREKMRIDKILEEYEPPEVITSQPCWNIFLMTSYLLFLVEHKPTLMEIQDVQKK